MKITVNLSPYEIMKLGKLTESDFGECWSPLVHTHDTVAFAIHNLINSIEFVTPIEEDECDGDCDNCDHCK